MSAYCTKLRNGVPCAKVIVFDTGCDEFHDEDRRSLLSYTESYTLEELAAQAMEPRPGVGMKAIAAAGKGGARISITGTVVQLGNSMTWHDRDPSSISDLRKLDQQETDHLIVKMLREIVRLEEVDELKQLAPEPSAVTHFVTHAEPSFTTESAWTFIEQRGGIHNDPLIRILAFRAFGRRDIDWRAPFSNPKPVEPPRRYNTPPVQQVPRGRSHMHQAGCSNPNCDGQCIESRHPTGLAAAMASLANRSAIVNPTGGPRHSGPSKKGRR